MAATELLKTILMNSANLKAYYRFESGALATDSSGNSYTLTDISDPALGTGKFGGGVDLDGNDAYSATDHADFKPTGNFSIGTWIKTSTTGTFMSLIHSGSEATSKYSGISLRVDTSNTAGIFSGKNTGTTVTTDWNYINGTTNVCDNNWHLVVGTWDGAYLRIYTDGKHDASVAWANAPAYQATNYVRIGNRNIGGGEANFFTGSLDDAFLVNGTALSADQIKELYEGRNLGELRPQTGLVGLYHLSNETDFSGSNFHLGNLNAATFAIGKLGKGVNLNGSNQGLKLAANYGIAFGSSYTFGGWVKLNTEIGSGTWILNALNHSASGADTSIIRYEYNSGTRRLKFVRYNSGAVDTEPLFNVTLGNSRYHHIVVVYDHTSTRMDLYLDGVSVVNTTSSNTAGTTGSYTQGFGIGLSANDTTTPTNAIFDEVFIFNVAKPASWVRQQYSLGRFGEL